MSLQYIIDGYNIINHPLFIQHATKKIKNSQLALLEFIKINKLCGSSKNKATVVFDGYPSSYNGKIEKTDIDTVFSRKETADERIKKMVEGSGNPRNLVVVSDDKEIKFFASFKGARWAGVEEFVRPALMRKGGIQRKLKSKDAAEDLLKPELNYSQINKINEELKKIWLK